jgi:hypothetical protein
VIVVNNTTSTTPPTLGEDATITTPITIPAVSVTDVEGASIEQDIAAGTTTATIHREVLNELDGALDSTLIAHEYGHYLHHRLALCGNKMCRALSEGWGDFTALLLLARAGDDLDGAFPFGVYVTQGTTTDPGYFGIRRAPYSANPSINSLSYRHMADGEPLPTSHPFQPNNDNSEVHDAGEVWASALWDGYVALQLAGTSFDEVRAKMARIVVAGLLLTPVEASPMEARDAILAAALAESPADHALVLEAFARRGFGSCAVAPPDGSLDFVGLVESTAIAGNARLVATSLADGCDEDGILDSGETARVTLQVGNVGHAALSDLTIAVTSAVPGVTIASPPASLATLGAGETAAIEVDVAFEPGFGEPVGGELAMQVTAAGGCATTLVVPFASRMNLDDRPQSSATDAFDAIRSDWVPWTAAWAHVRETPLDGAWHGEDLPIASDTRLTSPYLVADGTAPLTVTFEHSYSFESGSGMAFDGGVIEYSLGTDEVWQDVSAVALPGYTGVIADDPGNVLAGLPAFVGNSPSYPAADIETLSFGTAFAGQTFRLRFRIGTDSGGSGEGWRLDNVAFSGIVGTPFASQLADDGRCPGTDPDPDDPILSGGGGCCGVGGSRGDAVLALGVLALVLRRRRSPTRSSSPPAVRRSRR